MTINIDKLEALARAATPGEWKASLAAPADGERGEFWLVSMGDPKLALGVTIFDSTDIDSAENAAYIEAAQPKTILALIAEVRALREDKARLDSGCIMTNDYDEFGDKTRTERRGLNLRQMIDEAMAAAAKDKP